MGASLKILTIDDDELVTKAIKRTLSALGYQVETANSFKEGLTAFNEGEFDLVLTDLNMPDGDGMEIIKHVKEVSPFTEVIVISAHGSIARAVEATKAGAFYFIEKPIEPMQLELLVGKALERRLLVAESANLRKKLGDRYEYFNIIGRSRAMQHIFEMIENIAHTDANVLIIGESGTGKELIANAIHYNSPRARRPFVKVNCAALPKELIESEMFGHVRGAFTGATKDKKGLIAAANGGSLLLDEIAEMPILLQPKLLRVLQERTYRRVGSDREEQADFRLICSTNRDPQEAIEAGMLREDLFYRINTVTVNVPPLRERNEDIQCLAEHFLRLFAEKYNRNVTGFSSDAYERMFEYSWPGNVRELQNVIERAVLLSKSEVVELDELPVKKAAVARTAKQDALLDDNMTLDEIERAAVMRALERTGGNKQAAAELLGIYRPRIYNLMRKHKIPDISK